MTSRARVVTKEKFLEIEKWVRAKMEFEKKVGTQKELAERLGLGNGTVRAYAHMLRRALDNKK
jgi:adenylate cyclase class IV